MEYKKNYNNIPIIITIQMYINNLLKPIKKREEGS
jgi:hypothetical protein